eukprot:458627-Rhodomonas_salina.1
MHSPVLSYGIVLCFDLLSDSGCPPIPFLRTVRYFPTVFSYGIALCSNLVGDSGYPAIPSHDILLPPSPSMILPPADALSGTVLRYRPMLLLRAARCRTHEERAAARWVCTCPLLLAPYPFLHAIRHSPTRCRVLSYAGILLRSCYALSGTVLRAAPY